MNNNIDFVNCRVSQYAYDTKGRKFATSWKTMTLDWEMNASRIKSLYNFLKAYVNGEMRHQFKSNGKNYFFNELPQQCKNNLKGALASYEAFLSVPH